MLRFLPKIVHPLYIIGGAGGVGSIAIQLAKKLAGLTVVATASRPESGEWCRQVGADVIIDYRQKFSDQLGDFEFGQFNYVLCCNSMEYYLPQFQKLSHRRGGFARLWERKMMRRCS